MKGAKEVIEVLNEVLAGELVAINQYFLHAKMCENWGFKRLYETIRAESIDEMRHADAIVERVLFLEGLPNLQRLDKLHIGQTVVEQLKSDLELEHQAVKRLRDGIAICRDADDRTSEELLVSILKAEEEHIDWLETQLGVIDRIGDKHYLAQQLG
jgi:bacterioferritin